MWAVLGAGALGGWGALHIEVDVFKGSPAHDKAVQAIQVATLVMAAKPALAELRNSLYTKADGEVFDAAESGRTAALPLPAGCDISSQGLNTSRAHTLNTPQVADAPVVSAAGHGNRRRYNDQAIPSAERYKYSHSIQFDNEAANNLNALLSLYEPKVCVDLVVDWARARPSLGLMDLFSAVNATDGKSEGAARNTAHQKALTELMDSLIPFAERILFVVNSPTYAAVLDSSGQRAILQKLGDSLILHAKDLQQREMLGIDRRSNFDGQRRSLP